MTTAETTNQRATLEELSEAVCTAVNEARAAGIPEQHILHTLLEYATSSADIVCRDGSLR